jgi:glycosyltransferase involved in cell wall biosynthesis
MERTGAVGIGGSNGPLIVAAATFNRPQGLTLLLDRLEGLEFSGSKPPIEVVIVDNSPEGSARQLVEARRASYRWPLSYAHERQRGIAQARNRALDEAATRDAAWLAFIDDDEYPDPSWLDRMTRMASETGATAVVGALLPDFEQPPPRWIEKGGFLAIRKYAEGQRLDFGNTSNVLFDFRFAQRHGIRFDLSFALTGGEDTLFFEDMQRHGGTIVFCRSGVVHETIVPDRARLGWLVRRWIRSGNTDGRIVMRGDPGLRARAVTVFGGGLVRMAVGGGLAALTAPLILLGRGQVPAEHLRVASRGAGFAMSALGSTIEEYRVVKR